MESWLKPMLCGSTDVVPVSGDWQIEPKFDGWRTVMYRDFGTVKTYNGRNGNEYTSQLPLIEDAVQRLVPDGTALDGELIHKERGWGGVQSAMTSGTPYMFEDLVFIVFDVLRFAGADLLKQPLRNRREQIELTLPASELVIPAPVIDHLDDPLKAALGWKFEGVVCKHRDSTYKPDSRSPYWLKVKPQTTCEARIAGFKPGKRGPCSAFEIELLDNGAQTTCKVQDNILNDVMLNSRRWLGAVIEIAHHGLNESGKPRHPQYLRRRDDR